ncbi:hypothetical protein CL618_01960 [archaeon]|nr:hypothetical protein [archaeon]
MAKTSRKKKKIWYEILASKEFNNSVIGDTISALPDSLIGRTIKISLSDLIRNPRKQNIQLTFSINQVKEKANTELTNYELSSSFVKRIIKPGKNKIDDSFILKTKDDIQLRVKPLLITKSKVQKSISTTLKSKTKEHLTDYFKKNNFSAIISALISYKLQKTLKDHLKKTYPLRTFEIRVLKKIKSRKL